MKKQLTNYTFNPTAKTVTLLDSTSYKLNQLLLITNVTSNIIIYNFAEPTLGASLSNNIITLDYNTSSMGINDDLQIFVEVQDNSDFLLGLTFQISQLIDTVKSLSHVDAQNRQRVAVDTMPTTSISGTVGLSAGTQIQQVYQDQQVLGTLAWDTLRKNLSF